MYRKILLCLFFILFSIPAYSSEYIPGDVLIVLKPADPSIMVTASDLDAFGLESFRVASFAAESGAWVKETYASLSEAGNEVFALIHSDSKSADELTQELLKHPEVLAASPNYRVYASLIPDDTRLDDCWGMEYINVFDAWDITTGDSSIYVAVIDSGIDHTNPDLTANVDTSLGYNTIYGESYPASDDFGHGTHVAGTIGAIGNNRLGIAGVNWNVKLISVKALNRRGAGSVDTVIKAINYVAELIRTRNINIKAVNLSLETYVPLQPTHDNLVAFPLWRAFKELDNLNKAVIVVAAGNQNITVGQPTRTTRRSGGSTLFTPGCYVYPPSFQGLNNMISVSALNSDGGIAYFSNNGADISAPGMNILSTWIQSDSRYMTSENVSLRSSQGTSMAAPHISGTVALLASIMPDRTAYQLKQAILCGVGATSVDSSASSGGVLDVMAAIDYQNSNRNIPAISTEWSEYEDYNGYEVIERDYYENFYENEGASVGECNSVLLNAFAVMLIYPLVKNFVS